MDNNQQRIGESGIGDQGAEYAELITRLEKATVPDRALEGAIARAIGGEMPADPVGWPPRYMESIDAAMTLVPDGWAWFVEWIGEPFSEGDARLWIPSQRSQGLSQESFDVHKAATPAIALCIAALKARAALSKAETR